MNGSTKRPHEEDSTSAKRVKQDGASLSNLLRKVGSNTSASVDSSSDSKRLKMQERVVAANLKSEELKGSTGESN